MMGFLNEGESPEVVYAQLVANGERVAFEEMRFVRWMTKEEVDLSHAKRIAADGSLRINYGPPGISGDAAPPLLFHANYLVACRVRCGVVPGAGQ